MLYSNTNLVVAMQLDFQTEQAELFRAWLDRTSDMLYSKTNLAVGV